MSGSDIANGVEAISKCTEYARHRLLAVMAEQPTSITYEVVDGLDAMAISWITPMSSPYADDATITLRLIATGPKAQDFSVALELIKNSTTTSDSRSETDE